MGTWGGYFHNIVFFLLLHLFHTFRNEIIFKIQAINIVILYIIVGRCVDVSEIGVGACGEADKEEAV